MDFSSDTLDKRVRNACGGDLAALEELLLHFHDPLLHAIEHDFSRQAVPGVNPEDLLQETFMEAFQRVKGLEARGSKAFFSWLKTIADTRMMNAARTARAQKRGGGRHRVTRPTIADTSALSILACLQGADPTPSRVSRKKETVDAIMKTLATLDPLRRHIMHLRFAEGMSVEEVAAATGKSQGAVKMLINRSLKDLRERIGKNFGELSSGA